jgi:hypothetical protein
MLATHTGFLEAGKLEARAKGAEGDLSGSEGLKTPNPISVTSS